jgi:HEAT repeats
MSYRFKLSLLTCAFFLGFAAPPVYAAKTSEPPPKNWTGIIMTALVMTSTVGGIAYRSGYGQGCNKSSARELELSLQSSIPVLPEVVLPSNPIALHPQEQPDLDKVNAPSSSETSFQSSTVSETTRLAKIEIVAELIQDLQSPDSSQRCKAIWALGQRGDSRAVQPLVDLMMDSDSSQRSLILAAVSEIGIQTLKPVNRALMLSLQDGSSDVRKNGIRDVTRMYDLLGQVSQLLQHAASDPDEEVQETATWALMQLNQIRSLAGRDNLPQMQSGLGFRELASAREQTEVERRF